MAAPPEIPAACAPTDGRTQRSGPRWPSRFRDETKQWLDELHSFHRRLDRLTATADDRVLRPFVGELAQLRNQPGTATRAFACSDAIDTGDAIALRCIDLLLERYDQPRHLIQLVRLPLFDQRIRVLLADRVEADGSTMLLADLATQLELHHLNFVHDDEALPARVRFALGLQGMWLSETAFDNACRRFAALGDQARRIALVLMGDWEGADTAFLDVAAALAARTDDP